MLGTVGEYGSGRYTASTGSTTTVTSGSSGTASAPGGAVRRVRLARPLASTSAPCAPPTFGFSVRGGREHSTGFFVSHVEPASEAYNQGLKVGDQVVRVNGFRVGDALHKELLGLISGLNYLKLKVRNVGMIPVKDKSNDPLTWRMIPETMLYADSVNRSSPSLSSNKDDKIKDIRLTLYVPSRSKLGCGICKGPDWRPGIFVQFTKENGIARESGLRPGDQIMQCNGIDFRDIQFSDAVSLMKQAKRLDLWVRTGAGLDLFPGESSGYNSSASSATGDQSPSSADHKRLSIVKEETLDLEDRLSQLDNGRYRRRTCDLRNCEWEREISIKESDSECANDYCDSPVNNYIHKSSYDNYDKNKLIPQNRTIINLSEKGTTIQTNYVLPTNDEILNNNNEHKSSIITSTPDKKTIVVDVHRSDCEQAEKTKINVTNIECQNDTNNVPLKKVPSTGSFVSLTNSTTSSLSNAISEELQRRSQRTKDVNFDIYQMEEARKNKVLKGVDDEKKLKHDALMDEFKKAHRKMFAGSQNDQNGDSVNNDSKKQESDKNVDSANTGKSKTSTIDRHANSYSRLSTIPKDYSAPTKVNGVAETNGVHKRNGSLDAGNGPKRNGIDVANGPKLNGTNAMDVAKRNGTVDVVDSTKRNGGVDVVDGPKRNGTLDVVDGPKRNGTLDAADGPRRNFKSPSQPPPPPPPMPMSDKPSKVLNLNKPNTKPKAPPPPPLKKVTQNGNVGDKMSKPPLTPTPDYDSSSLIKVTSKPKPLKIKSDIVEMESLESFKLNNPSSPPPKPPSTYFMKQHNGTLTMKKASQPISVTIGEYPTNTFRKQPSKLEFLNGDTAEEGFKNNEPVGSRLQSELSQLLSRSNLKKKTESDLNGEINMKMFENPFDSQRCEEPNANFNKRYGHTTLPQPPMISIPKVPITKSLSHGVTVNGNHENGRLASQPTKQELTKTESLPQGGILKNSTPIFINERNNSLKIGIPHKTIKFGQTTTVIGDPELPVMINH